MLGSMKHWCLLGVAGATLAFLPLEVTGSDEGRKVPDQERELVRAIHDARDGYQASLERLRAYYVHINNHEAQTWVERELTEYHLIVKNPYLLDMDLPSEDLKPDTNIAKANRIFREAVDWMNKRAVMDTTKSGNYKRAELLFQRLIHDYPRSDKLDEACYYLGQIYSSKYFEQYRRGVAYYERVFHYEPNTNLDARIKAAQLYEKYVDDRRRAVELYQDVLHREVDPEQTKEARRRLDGLISTKTANRQ